MMVVETQSTPSFHSLKQGRDPPQIRPQRLDGRGIVGVRLRAQVRRAAGNIDEFCVHDARA